MFISFYENLSLLNKKKESALKNIYERENNQKRKEVILIDNRKKTIKN